MKRKGEKKGEIVAREKSLWSFRFFLFLSSFLSFSIFFFFRFSTLTFSPFFVHILYTIFVYTGHRFSQAISTKQSSSHSKCLSAFSICPSKITTRTSREEDILSKLFTSQNDVPYYTRKCFLPTYTNMGLRYVPVIISTEPWGIAQNEDCFIRALAIDLYSRKPFSFHFVALVLGNCSELSLRQ